MNHPLAISGLLRVEVSVLLSDWYFLYEQHLEEYKNNCSDDVFDPRSDAGRAKLLGHIQSKRGVQLMRWTGDEIMVLLNVVLPRRIIREATSAGCQPQILDRIFKAWEPRLFDWLTLLWDLSGHACELFADMLYVLPKEQRAPPEDMMRQLFRWMPYRKLYSEWTCVSIATAIVPFSKSPSCARVQANYISQAINIIPPYHIGLMIRCILLGVTQPIDCNCGYNINEPFCTCIHPDTRKRNGNNLDCSQVFATILLKLVLEQVHSIPSFHPTDVPWTNQMRDEMIQSACEYVFTQSGYRNIYRAVTLLQKIPPLLKHARDQQYMADAFSRREKDSKQKDMMKESENVLDTLLGFDNSVAQTGSCVVANCKQTAKDGCANVSCKTHCKDFFFECRQHRHYPQRIKYMPRKNVDSYVSNKL